MGLLKQFEGMQLPAASELEWLVPEHDAPQKVRVCMCVCVQEGGRMARVAPPRHVGMPGQEQGSTQVQ